MSDLIDRQTLINMLTRTPGVGNRILDVVRTAPSVNSVSTPCQQDVNGDVIDRQAAIDAFNTNLNGLVVGGEENAKTVENYLNGVIEKIKCLPSAEPEREKGNWIEHNPHRWGLGIVFECSECGEEIECESSNFCPNCGADMRGEEE